MSARHDFYTRKILTNIEAGRPVTQRSLSRELGIALGLTNLLVRRIIKKGWVKVTTVPRNRVKYMITPAGMVEKGRVTRLYFENTVRLYTETRERIRQSLVAMSARVPSNGRAPRVVFYGAGEVAEIGYVSLQGTGIELVGVVDDHRSGSFFGLPVQSPAAIQTGSLDGRAFDRLVVMSFRRANEIRGRLAANGFPQDRIFWLD